MPHQTFLSLAFWHLLVLSSNLSLTNNSTQHSSCWNCYLLSTIRIVELPHQLLANLSWKLFSSPLEILLALGSAYSIAHYLLHSVNLFTVGYCHLTHLGFLLALSSLHISYAIMLVQLIPSFSKSTASTDLHNLLSRHIKVSFKPAIFPSKMSLNYSHSISQRTHLFTISFILSIQ